MAEDVLRKGPSKIMLRFGQDQLQASMFSMLKLKAQYKLYNL
ncbi:hypothetical protein COLO4_03555 [Corchorus olitorius]|uniref:Uncharacterized protein n=1 Tax=Corchorus olitorius TaxID=93759 RepID=A0A1R3KY75_9ROSI|nr:hypothetical protein COLO4_03555 [Corchorus olitorius]